MGSSSGAIRAGRAFVEFFADSTKLESALKNIHKKITGFGEMLSGVGKKMTMLGGAIVAPLLAAAHTWAEAGAKVHALSLQLGMSAEAITSMGYAAEMSHSSIDELAGGLTKMQKFLYVALTGAEKNSRALRTLGLSISALRGLSPDEQFKKIADGLAQIQSPAVRTALALEIFGRGAASLIPLITKGSAGIEEYQRRAEQLGMVMSGKTAADAAALEEAFVEMGKAIKGVWKTIGAAVGPVVKAWAEQITDLAIRVNKFVRTHREMVVLILAGGVALMVAGTALIFLGKALVVVMSVGSSLSKIFSALWGVVQSFGGLIALVFTNPLAATIAVIAAVAGAILWLSGQGARALAWLGDQFTLLKTFARAAFQGIADALLAGDFVLAAQILWTSLKIAWRTGCDEIKQIWTVLWTNAKQVMLLALGGLLMGLEKFSHAVVNVWIDMTSLLMRIWIRFIDWYNKIIARTATGMASMMAESDIKQDVEQRFYQTGSAFSYKNVHKLSDAEAKQVNAEFGVKGIKAGDILSPEQLKAMTAYKLNNQANPYLASQLKGEEDSSSKAREAALKDEEASRKARHAKEDSLYNADMAKYGTPRHQAATVPLLA